MEKQFERYGAEWAKEAARLPKKQLVEMLADANKYKRKIAGRTFGECQKEAQKILNDFESGATSKEEAFEALMDYTLRLHDIFNEQAQKLINNLK